MNARLVVFNKLARPSLRSPLLLHRYKVFISLDTEFRINTNVIVNEVVKRWDHRSLVEKDKACIGLAMAEWCRLAWSVFQDAARVSILCEDEAARTFEVGFGNGCCTASDCGLRWFYRDWMDALVALVPGVRVEEIVVTA